MVVEVVVDAGTVVVVLEVVVEVVVDVEAVVVGTAAVVVVSGAAVLFTGTFFTGGKSLKRSMVKIKRLSDCRGLTSDLSALACCVPIHPFASTGQTHSYSHGPFKTKEMKRC